MKKIACEICGSDELVKNDGLFVCKSCGCKYDADEIKRMLIDGVVQIEGTVDINRDEVIAHTLELARNADESGNLDQAEEYADKVITMDSSNQEAWLIKAKAANLSSSIANDRYEEVVNILTRLTSNISKKESGLQLDDITLLLSISKIASKAVLLRYENAGGAFSSALGRKYGAYMLEHLPDVMQKFKELIVEIEDIANSKGYTAEPCASEAFIKDKFKELSNRSEELGEMYYFCGHSLSKSCADAYSGLVEYFNKNRIFDYFGVGDHDWSDEENLFDQYVAALDNIRTVQYSAIIPFLEDHAYDYVVNQHAVVSILPNADQYTVPAVGEKIESAYKNQIILLEAKRDARTNRRYYNQFSSGAISNDGFGFREEQRERFNDQITKLRKEMKDTLHTARIKNEEAQQRRIQNYWSEHPEKKNSLEQELAQLENSISEFSSNESELKNQLEKLHASAFAWRENAEKQLADSNSTIQQLEKTLSGLGLFKKKEKKALQSQIDTAKQNQNTLKKSFEQREKDAQAQFETDNHVLLESKSKLSEKIQEATDRIEEIRDELSKPR